MVNLKKISAIATGALFVGATLGTASAAFTGSMLVSGDAAAAKLVTSTQNPDATGNAADAAAANTVNDAVSDKYSCAGSSGGATCQYEYDDENFYGNETTTEDDVTKTDVGTTQEGYWIAKKTGANKSMEITSWTLDANSLDSKKGMKFDVMAMAMLRIPMITLSKTT
jgi:hypothetical protein